jgi:hypothetical protein
MQAYHAPIEIGNYKRVKKNVGFSFRIPMSLPKALGIAKLDE